MYIHHSSSCHFYISDLKGNILFVLLDFCFDHMLCVIVPQFQNDVHICVALISSVSFLVWFRLLDSVYVCTTLTISDICTTYGVIFIYIMLSVSVSDMPNSTCLFLGTTKIYILSYFCVLLLLYMSLTD